MSYCGELLKRYFGVDEVTGTYVGNVVRKAKVKANTNALNAWNKRSDKGSSKPNALADNNLQAATAQNAHAKINKFVNSKNDPKTIMGKRYLDGNNNRTSWGTEFDRTAKEE